MTIEKQAKILFNLHNMILDNVSDENLIDEWLTNGIPDGTTSAKEIEQYLDEDETNFKEIYKLGTDIYLSEG